MNPVMPKAPNLLRFQGLELKVTYDYQRSARDHQPYQVESHIQFDKNTGDDVITITDEHPEKPFYFETRREELPKLEKSYRSFKSDRMVGFLQVKQFVKRLTEDHVAEMPDHVFRIFNELSFRSIKGSDGVNKAKPLPFTRPVGVFKSYYEQEQPKSGLRKWLGMGNKEPERPAFVFDADQVGWHLPDSPTAESAED